jgi:hypothetical protein
MTDHLTGSERALREAAEAALDCHQVLESDPRAVLALLDEIERLRGALHLFPNPQKFWEEAKWAGEVSNWWHAHKEEIDCAALAPKEKNDG